jgi:MptA/FolE2 family GTP cyclohydrolase
VSTATAATTVIPDVQGGSDDRGVCIDEVGIDGLSYPVEVAGRDGASQRTVARATMTVELSADQRGVHMSRFVELLDEQAGAISQEGFGQLVESVRQRLDSRCALVELSFPYFLRREAPASGAASMNRYDCRLVGKAMEGEAFEIEVGVCVPVTSRCPCSKEISDYGAHNQRGHVEIQVKGDGLWFEDLIEVAEESGSAPILALLKRPDEKVVTMQAYDNPAFVEDLVRDVLVALRDDARVSAAAVSITNQESIHAHEAVARLRWERRDG